MPHPSPQPPRAVLGLCDGADLIAALQSGQPAAAALLFDQYAPKVRRILARVLGVDSELPDLLQEVFLRALEGVHRLGPGDPLERWLTGIAVHTARQTIRRRWRWLRPLGLGAELEPVPVPPADLEATRALRDTYAVLERMPAEERLAFALRFLEGMELTEVAECLGVSLATLKRRLAKAERRFEVLGRRFPALVPWLDGGDP